MAHYIIQTIAFQVFFLLIYDVFLKKETFFNWNRFYLIATAILSIILPFIKIENFKSIVPHNYIISLPEIVIGQTTPNTNTPILLDAVVIGNSISYWQMAFYLGVTMAAFIFLFKLTKIVVLIFKNPKTNVGKLTLVKLINSNAAFSFFRYVFLGEFLKQEEKETILKHEIIHVKQMHSIDLLFFEILRILFWFNPLTYMYQNRITALHEFIADAEAVKHENKSKYYQNLLSQVFETKNMSFINPFFKQSLIKKRIVMLSKTKSKQIHLIKYALLIPMILGMLVYTSSDAQEKTNLEQRNVVSELNEYSYNLKKGEKLKGGKREIHEKYEDFLKNNPEYVSWTQIDRTNDIVYYSVHHVSEKVPDSLSKSSVNNPNDGSSYVMYINWGKPTIKETQESKKQKKELLKQTEEFKNVLDVPFAVIDQVPVFQGCEDMSIEEQRDCISRNISIHVNKNFNTKLADELKLTGRQRINVIFKINTEGDIIDIKSRAPHPDLEAEAIRVIKMLPKMIPGEHNGKKVNVPYSLPIIFQVQDDVINQESEAIPLDEVEVPFAVIENVPVYPGCEDLESNVEKKNCMSQKLTNFVIEHFNTKKASEYGLVGRQRINVIFKIDAKGNIVGVRSRGPHPALEAEAIRVISSLPKMKPGIQRGEAVTVPYSLPIIFEVKDILMLDEVAVTDISNETNVEVPFAVVDQAPIFPGCEDMTNEEQRDCMVENISMHINKNFNTKLANELKLTGRQRINVIFKIDTEGHVTDIRSRAPHPDLEEEAIRVIKTLPKMIPGEHGGEKVTIPYSLPIIFQVADVKAND